MNTKRIAPIAFAKVDVYAGPGWCWCYIKRFVEIEQFSSKKISISPNRNAQSKRLMVASATLIGLALQ